MLSHEELAIILNKDALDVADMILLHNHIEEIGKLKDKPDAMPVDVFATLQSDLEAIIDRLQHERKRLTGGDSEAKNKVKNKLTLVE